MMDIRGWPVPVRLVLVGVAALVALLAAAGLPLGVRATVPPAAQARFVGPVSIDGSPAASGTIVQARIGDVVCGMSPVFQGAGEARYVLNVVAEGALPGCGSDGALVTFLVGGHAVATAAWANFELNSLPLALSSAEALSGDGTISLAPPLAQARFVGTVLLDGAPPPSGTIVQARIGDVVCGMSRTFEEATTSRFVLNVVSESALPGCGSDGAEVTFSVGGQPAGWAPWTNFELHQLDLVAMTLP